MSYTLTQDEYRRLKRRLTYRQNRLKRVYHPTIGPVEIDAEARETLLFEARQLVKEVEYADGIFDEKGYPDYWNNWARAKEDAQLIIIRYKR